MGGWVGGWVGGVGWVCVVSVSVKVIFLVKQNFFFGLTSIFSWTKHLKMWKMLLGENVLRRNQCSLKWRLRDMHHLLGLKISKFIEFSIDFLFSSFQPLASSVIQKTIKMVYLPINYLMKSSVSKYISLDHYKSNVINTEYSLIKTMSHVALSIC